MNETYSADPTSIYGNLQGGPESFDLSEYFDSLTDDDNLIDGLPDERQGIVLTDRVIGAIIAKGRVEGSRVSYTPREILEGIDGLAAGDYDNKLGAITRKGGMRTLADKLAQDARTGPLVGQLLERSGLGIYEGSGFASLSMLEGYLDGIEKTTTTNRVAVASYDWRKAIVSGVELYARTPTMKKWDEGIGAYRPADDGGRGQAATLARNLETARSIGVDFTLIQDTAEKLRKYYEQSRDIGRAALRSPTYGI